MEYTEFQNKIEHRGYVYQNTDGAIYVGINDGHTLIFLSKKDRFTFECDWLHLSQLEESEVEFLIKLSHELVCTPPKEREEGNLNSISQRQDSEMKLIYANKEERLGGWTLSVDFLKKVRDTAHKRELTNTSLETTENILLAFHEVRDKEMSD